MSASGARPDFSVIDADGHVIEPPGLWKQYSEQKLWNRLPRPVRDENGLFCYAVGDRLLMRSASRMAMEPRPGESGELRAGGSDPVARLADMDLDGMDVAFLYPTLAFFFPELDDAELHAGLCRAYNRWLADYCKTDPRRLVGIALLPLEDVDESIRELERCAREHGFRGAFARPNPYRGRPLQSPAYDPLFARAAELGVALTVHEGISETLPTLGRERSENPVIQHLMSHPFEQMAACAGLILSGALERHPELRVVFLESGCGWLPYWLERMDGHAQNWRRQLPRLKAKPSEYFRRQCFVSMDPDDACAPAVLAALGDDCVVWASDYPHTDHEFPGAVRSTLEILARAGPGAARAVLEQNPRRLYRL